ncbi:hypothetical protein CLIB1444_01S06744 [[Candida] jaroonii]|uniref:Uncharacterized protein n=1 Tax=[Candida] jaroonii TaxID=467808 RepID=A0ACA9Y0H7_9ASCO|nr:hypothetical protein CLIB1444_01S06744 [[Candida] jaroonii]
MIITFDSKKSAKGKSNVNSSSNELSSTTNDSILLKNENKAFKSIRRSRNGCVTCKIRKKKCDEIKPLCSECKRLKKECIWVDHDKMDESKIKEIKKIVEKSESVNKLRKRKKTIVHGNLEDLPNAKRINSPGLSPILNHVKDEFEIFDPLSPDNSSFNNALLSPPFHQIVHNPIESCSRLEAIPHRQTINYNIPNETDAPEVIGEVNANNEKNEQQIAKINSLVAASPNSLSPLDFYNYLRDFGVDFMQDYNIKSPDSPNFNQMFNNLTTPSPNFSLSPLPMKLDDRSLELYNYYVTVLSPHISVAPKSNANDENHYQKVFLPLAHQDDGIMYSVLAWSSFHMGRHASTEEGSRYLEKAIKHFHSLTSNDKNTVIVKLATLMVLLGAEICRGDVVNWTQYMEWGSKLIQSNGGLSNFNRNKQEIWLISDFAYHDVLSSNLTERGAYFKVDEYKEVFNHDLTSGISNPLFGIAKNIYPIIGEISHLAFETNENLKNLVNELNEKNISDSPINEIDGLEDIKETDSDLSNHAKMNSLLISVIEQIKVLDNKIENAKPNKEDLYGLNEEEFEWQITLFETFKLSAKLYLRQSIGKCNPSTLESQVLNNDLIKCLDIVLGSPVESVLVLPVFIAAIHCVTKLQRNQMSRRIDGYIKTYGPWSNTRVKEVITKIWDLNPDGDKAIDWHAILKELGWEINFA